MHSPQAYGWNTGYLSWLVKNPHGDSKNGDFGDEKVKLGALCSIPASFSWRHSGAKVMFGVGDDLKKHLNSHGKSESAGNAWKKVKDPSSRLQVSYKLKPYQSYHSTLTITLESLREEDRVAGDKAYKEVKDQGRKEILKKLGVVVLDFEKWGNHWFPAIALTFVLSVIKIGRASLMLIRRV